MKGVEQYFFPFGPKIWYKARALGHVAWLGV